MTLQTIQNPGAIIARIQDQLRQQLGENRYANCWTPSARLGFDASSNAIQVSVPNGFFLESLTRQYGEQLKQAVRDTLGHDAPCNFEVAPEAFNPAAASAAPRPAAKSLGLTAPSPATSTPTKPNVDPQHTRSTARPVHIEMRYRLDAFVVGACNQLAHTAAERIAFAVAHPEHADAPDAPSDHGATGFDAPRTLFLHGGCGLGKTHLLKGVVQRVLALRPNAKVLFLTAEDFTNRYVAAIRKGKTDDFRKKLRAVDLLAVDDVQFLASRSKTREEFLQTFNQIDLSGARVIMAADQHPRAIPGLPDALVSRCVQGLVAQLEKPDAVTQRKLVLALADRAHLTLAPTVVDALSRRAIDSVRDLEGLFMRLTALASVEKTSQIGFTLLDRLDGPSATSVQPTTVPLPKVLRGVMDELGVTVEQFEGTGRHPTVVLARRLVVHLAKDLTHHSYPEIARAMKRPNHSSVITAHKTFRGQLERDELIPIGTGRDPLKATDLLGLVKHRVITMA